VRSTLLEAIPMNYSNAGLCLLCCAVPAIYGPACAQTVEITASREAARQLGRQLDTAALTVVGRDELLRYGDQSVADALRRMPGITVGGVAGRATDIRMRGLGNGYTRLLLDGQPAPAGFAIESLSPEQIERVEIARVASAETGAQAIAGTINIVLRKSAAKPERDVKVALALAHDKPTTEVVGQWSAQGAGGGGARWNASFGVVGTDARADSATTYQNLGEDLGEDAVGVPVLARRGRTHQAERRPTLNLTPRLAWTLANGDTVTSQNFLRFLALDMGTQVSERTSLGLPTSYPDTDSRFRAHTSTQRNDLTWLHPLPSNGGNGSLEVQLGRSHFQRAAVNVFKGFAATREDDVVRIVDSTARETSWTFNGKLKTAPSANHSLVAGWDGASGERLETRLEAFDYGAPGVKEVSQARLSRLALYLQDDWTLAAVPALSLSLGARWELVRIASEGNVLESVGKRLVLGGPLLQARLKTSGEGQLRAGLTRTFKMPSLTQLSMRRYTVDNGNSPLAPDEQGNAALQPERAWGLDLAYEHYFSKEAMASVSVYARRIDDVTVTALSQHGASWVATPANGGRAEARGIELEYKAPVGLYTLRLNGARNWSRLDAVAGPDNRIPNQVPFSAAIAIERRLTVVPVQLAASWNVQGGVRTREFSHISRSGNPQSELNASVLWRVNARSAWRLSVANALGRRHDEAARFMGAGGSLTEFAQTPTWATVRVGFETKL
jgi:outer membrane receptor for ferrienterochelin and colicin